jgi:hypothetical protein
MVLLRYLALAFIDTFGITHPSVEARDRSARYIALLMVSLLGFLCVAIFLAIHILSN